MATIYVVTSGSYSDYRINAVFSTKEQAEQYVRVHDTGRYSEFDIEEYALDQPIDRVRYKAASAVGDPIWISVYDRDEDDSSPPAECVRLWQHGRQDTIQYEAIIEAEDAEHARKIAGEKIAVAFSGQKVLPVVGASTDNPNIGYATLERVDRGTHLHFVEEPVTG